MLRIVGRQASSAAVTHNARRQAAVPLKARNICWLTTWVSRRFINIGEVRFTKDHEWLRLEKDNNVTVGVTHYAQDSLGDITYAEVYIYMYIYIYTYIYIYNLCNTASHVAAFFFINLNYC